MARLAPAPLRFEMMSNSVHVAAAAGRKSRTPLKSVFAPCSKTRRMLDPTSNVHGSLIDGYCLNEDNVGTRTNGFVLSYAFAYF